jgi:hypothetical protein
MLLGVLNEYVGDSTAEILKVYWLMFTSHLPHLFAISRLPSRGSCINSWVRSPKYLAPGR